MGARLASGSCGCPVRLSPFCAELFLSRCRFLSLKQQSQRGVLQSNLLPYGYRPGARYDLNLPHPPKLQDRYICDSPILRDAKAALAPWIWDTCNVVLNYVFLEGGIPLTSDDLTPSRADAMRRAVSFMRSIPNNRYADRPEQPLGSSRAMTLLREALGQAPIAPAPDSAQWGATIQGLDFISTETHNYYDWNAEYLRRVFTAAIGVIEELGTGLGGMFTACWEIYDKVRPAALSAVSVSTCERLTSSTPSIRSLPVSDSGTIPPAGSGRTMRRTGLIPSALARGCVVIYATNVPPALRTTIYSRAANDCPTPCSPCP
ncbi:hypothetical protein LXA43DRAFT_321339 [Ganoderma leucocontextum]|nr:hypothetical protein LXA43DRAFT_321339 [Ganoderma leucocontextum]